MKKRSQLPATSPAYKIFTIGMFLGVSIFLIAIKLAADSANSEEIVGANIGAGILGLVGLTVGSVCLGLLLVSLKKSKTHKDRGVILLTAILAIVAATFGFLMLGGNKPSNYTRAIQEAQTFTTDAACTDVITPAVHLESGAVYTFPSGCLPEGWVIKPAEEETPPANSGGDTTTTPTYNLSQIRECPDSWIDNRMPQSIEAGAKPVESQYFIVDGKRRELIEYDLAWVKANCLVEPSPVY